MSDSKPTRDEYFAKVQQERNAKYKFIWDGLDDWDKEFLEEFEGIDGQSWEHGLGLLDRAKQLKASFKQSLIQWLEGEKKEPNPVITETVVRYQPGQFWDNDLAFNQALNKVIQHLKESDVQ